MRIRAFLVLALASGAVAAQERDRSYALRVHLLTDDDRIELHRSAGALICTAPCGVVLDLRPGDLFYFGGTGIAQSDDFTFHPRNGEVTVRVNARPEEPRTVARNVLIAGAVLIAAGTALSYVAVVQRAASCADTTTCTGGQATLYAAIAVDVVGLAVIVGGLIYRNEHPATDWSVVQ